MEARAGTAQWETVAAVVLGALLAIALVLMLAAGIAGLMFGGAWAGGSLGDMPEVLVRLREHLGDPRQAWPPAARSRLPSASGFYVALGLVLGSGMAIAGLVAHLLRRDGKGRAARWARRRELRSLRIRRPVPGRVTLGRHGRRLLAAEHGQSALVIAPTQSGKTSALAVPAILEWAGPVIAVSVKNDLIRDTVARRSSLGRVAVFDPTGSTGLASTASWTPLMTCREWAGARKVANWLATAAAPSRRGLTDGDFWYSAAAKLLAPLLFAAATSGLTMDEVVAWVDTQDDRMVLLALEGANCPEAMNAMQANWARDERQRSSVYTTAETILEAYADPGVLARSRLPQIRADWLLDGGAHTLFICASAREQRRLRPVFVALLEEILEAAYDAAGQRGGPLEPPLLVVLDEVANIAPLPDLDVLVSTGASHGVQVVTILQDLAQANDRWGRERADTIVNNHRAKVLGAGLADERTLDWVGRLLGDQTVRQHSTTAGEPGRRTVTESSAFRPLAPANVMREARAGSALLVYGNLRPAWIRLRPWFKDPRLRRLAGSRPR